MKKYLALILALVLLVGVFASCAPAAPVETDPPVGEETPVPTDEATPPVESEEILIGYAISVLNDTGQTICKGGAEEKAAELGARIEVTDCADDVLKQQDAVNAFIEKGVDAIIVIPIDTSAMEPITEACTEAGIPLVYANRNPFGDEVADVIPEATYFVGSEEFIAGEFQAIAVAEALGNVGNIAILQGELSNEAALKRTAGVEETLAEIAPEIVVLAKEAGNWQRDQGMTITENWLTAYGDDLNAVVANNDEMALGAVQALQAAGRTDVFVFGVDAIEDALEAIEAGTMTGTIKQDMHAQGMGAVEFAVAHVKGEVLDSRVNWIPFTLID